MDRQFNACSPCCPGIRIGVEPNGTASVGQNCMTDQGISVDRMHWDTFNGKDKFFFYDRNYGIVGMTGTFQEDGYSKFKVWTNYDHEIATWFREWVWGGGRLVICGDLGGVVPEGKRIVYGGRKDPNTDGNFYGIHQSKLELNNSFLGTLGSSISFQEGMYGFATSSGSGTFIKWKPTYCQVAGNYPLTENAFLIPNMCCCQVAGGTTLFTDQETGVPIGAIEKIGTGYVMALGSAYGFFVGNYSLYDIYIDNCPFWEVWYTEYNDLLQFSDDE